MADETEVMGLKRITWSSTAKVTWFAVSAAVIVLVVCLSLVIVFQTSGASNDSVTVLKPGGPGGGEATAVPKIPLVSDADVDFVAGMIPHHEQALVLIDLLTERTHDGQTLALAQRMRDSQVGELEVLRAWQESHADIAHGHSHAHALGMATAAEIQELTDSTGVDAEIFFLELMIRHHLGAIDMATTRLEVSGEWVVTNYARNVFAEQSVEVTRMNELMATLTPALSR